MIILHQQFLSLQPHPQALLPLPFITKRCRNIPVPGFGLVGGDVEVPGKRVRRFTNLDSRRRRAVERESEFEVDPDKAREALRKLDQQLESISQKQVDPRPKIIGNYPPPPLSPSSLSLVRPIVLCGLCPRWETIFVKTLAFCCCCDLSNFAP